MDSRDGSLWASDIADDSVYQFSATGEQLAWWRLTDDRTVRHKPTGLGIDYSNDMIVMAEDVLWPDTHDQLAFVVWLDSTGAELHRFQMYAPFASGMAVSSVDGTVYAIDLAENQILLFHAPPNPHSRGQRQQAVRE